MTLPIPPAELAAYVGNRHDEDPVARYLEVGAVIRSAIDELLGPEWDWNGKSVLDFGCGSGRVLRHFLPEARDRGASFTGSDIHAPSIEWLNTALNPPMRGLVNGETPPLDVASASMDLVWSTSVFTHLSDLWAPWLAELHRVLKPHGVLIVTILGGRYAPVVMDVPFDPDKVGMTVLGHGAPWEAGGPMVLHSEWWIRAHWGRAFEVERYQDGGFAATDRPGTQGVVVLRKRDVGITAAQLEAIEPGEPREVGALQFALERTQWERADLNRRHDEYVAAYAALSEEHAALRERCDAAVAAERAATAELRREYSRPYRVAARRLRRAVGRIRPRPGRR